VIVVFVLCNSLKLIANVFLLCVVIFSTGRHGGFVRSEVGQLPVQDDAATQPPHERFVLLLSTLSASRQSTA
jgi:hypothetical protein